MFRCNRFITNSRGHIRQSNCPLPFQFSTMRNFPRRKGLKCMLTLSRMLGKNEKYKWNNQLKSMRKWRDWGRKSEMPLRISWFSRCCKIRTGKKYKMVQHLFLRELKIMYTTQLNGKLINRKHQANLVHLENTFSLQIKIRNSIKLLRKAWQPWSLGKQWNIEKIAQHLKYKTIIIRVMYRNLITKAISLMRINNKIHQCLRKRILNLEIKSAASISNIQNLDKEVQNSMLKTLTKYFLKRTQADRVKFKFLNLSHLMIEAA